MDHAHRLDSKEKGKEVRLVKRLLIDIKARQRVLHFENDDATVDNKSDLFRAWRERAHWHYTLREAMVPLSSLVSKPHAIHLDGGIPQIADVINVSLGQ